MLRYALSDIALITIDIKNDSVAISHLFGTELETLITFAEEVRARAYTTTLE